MALGLPGTEALALLGRETLLVFVLHLYLLFGGILGVAPLAAYAGRLDVAGACVALGLLVPLLLAAAWLALKLVSVAFLYEFFTRPW